ncbi:hypothetical protein [Magnetospirillum fulvum]|uniref:Secreted protein n=1 Tax=Magnetospirillum fulvum TaxID=1082 RepID=A0A1H6GVR2_MAGFU|nr:hypothetical protein [Magnetospirillum fulvum]SEH25915.1 hypothetical protein SAMN04244559_00340 [Magnetospirillum fulvum]
MIAFTSQVRGLIPLATTIMVGMLVASCAPVATAPQQVQSNLPNVTYRYSADQDLVQANQSAASYCTPYQSVPRAKMFSTDPDGSKTVVFECVRVAIVPVPLPVSPQTYNPNLIYSFRSDQELVDASRSAQSYCLSNGAEQVISTIGTSASGLRTITFQCVPH